MLKRTPAASGHASPDTSRVRERHLVSNTKSLSPALSLALALCLSRSHALPPSPFLARARSLSLPRSRSLPHLDVEADSGGVGAREPRHEPPCCGPVQHVRPLRLGVAVEG